MAGLLVSVRSPAEARLAVIGGASVIDVKEPLRGPLGCADPSVWQSVREVVPAEIPVSVALGEMGEWQGRVPIPETYFSGITYRKLGLSGAGPEGAGRWVDELDRWGGTTSWIAVIYTDWERAHAPHPDQVIDAAIRGRAAGVLIDTWTKSISTPLEEVWRTRFRQIQTSVGLLALAGGLNTVLIQKYQSFRPDLFAVRGAACVNGNRIGILSFDRVATLAAAANAVDLLIED